MNGNRLMATALVFALGGFAGCSDDDGPAGPGGGNDQRDWPAVDLPAQLVDGIVLSLDTVGDRTVGLAVGGDGAWVIERGPTGWDTVGDVPLPETMPPARGQIPAFPLFATALTIDGRGNVQVVGAEATVPAPVIWSEGDTGWELTNMTGTEVVGVLGSVVALGAQDIVGTGTGVTGFLAMTGSVYGGLSFGYVGTPGEPQENSLVDLAESSGVVYGVGYNDGADGSPGQPRRLVMRYSEDSWSMMVSPCGSCSGQNFSAVAATPFSVYVGGATTDGAEDALVAWLMEWSVANREWTEIVLPSAGDLDQVNDILVSSNGDIYLACGELGASIVRLPVIGDAVVEWEDAGIVLFELGETADGGLLAAGLIEGLDRGTPVVLERR